MAEITFITGGQRSGKSRYAQELARSYSKNPVYLATARRWDQDFEARIFRHQSDRDDHWTTIEEDKHLSKHNFSGKVVVLDCITLWLTNFFHDAGYNTELALEQAKDQWNALILQDFKLIAISNELGMGMHAQSEAGRNFTDLQGWMNQYIAASSTQVTFMVSGIPLKIK